MTEIEAMLEELFAEAHKELARAKRRCMLHLGLWAAGGIDGTECRRRIGEELDGTWDPGSLGLFGRGYQASAEKPC